MTRRRPLVVVLDGWEFMLPSRMGDIGEPVRRIEFEPFPEEAPVEAEPLPDREPVPA